MTEEQRALYLKAKKAFDDAKAELDKATENFKAARIHLEEVSAAVFGFSSWVC